MTAAANTMHIFRREFRHYFVTPIAYIVIAISVSYTHLRAHET